MRYKKINTVIACCFVELLRGKRWEIASRVPDRRCICRGTPEVGITKRTVWRSQYGKDAEKSAVSFEPFYVVSRHFCHHSNLNDSFCLHLRIFTARNRPPCSIRTLALHELHDDNPVNRLKRCCRSIISRLLSNEASNPELRRPCSHIERQTRNFSSCNLGLELLG